MLTLIAILLALAAPFIVLALRVIWRFRFIDFVPLLVMVTIAGFLRRFDFGWTIVLYERPFKGLLFVFAAWFLLLLLVRPLLRRWPALNLGSLVLPAILFAVLALVSGLVNRGDLVGVSSALQAVCMALLPLGVGVLAVDLLPRDRRSFENLVTTLLLFSGVIVPLIMLLNAVSRGTIASIMGWEEEAAGESGITQAMSFLGSRIASGLIVFLAYGLAMMRFVGKRQTWALVPLALCALAMLFSLSRTMILIMALFHVVFFWKTITRGFGRIAAVVLVAAVGAAIAAATLTPRFSFERFTSTSDPSLNLRLSGIRAAWVASAKAPVLGRGPGLLYEEFRTYFQLLRGEQKRREMNVEGYWSPMEPHNTYAYLAAEHGYPALILFIGIMVVCWRRTQVPWWRSLDRADQVYRAGFQALWLAWLAGMWVHSLPLVNMKAALVFWVFAGCGLLYRACLSAELAPGALSTAGWNNAPAGAAARRPRQSGAPGTVGVSSAGTPR